MFKILGYQKMQFTNESTGELVSGVKFHLLGDVIDQNGRGNVVLTKFFINNKIEGVPDVQKNLEFKISINSKGEPKVTGCKIL